MLLLRPTHNRHLQAIFENLDDHFHRIRLLCGRIPSRLQEFLEQHAEILDAVEADEGVCAAHLAREHLDSVYRDLAANWSSLTTQSAVAEPFAVHSVASAIEPRWRSGGAMLGIEAQRGSEAKGAVTSEAKIVMRNLEMAFVDRHAKTRTQALVDVNLTVHEAAFVCMLGPRGCGKSTILNVVAGFLAPTSGEVVVAGALVAGPSSG